MARIAVDLEPAWLLPPPLFQDQTRAQGVSQQDIAAASAAVITDVYGEDEVVTGCRIAGPGVFVDIEERVIFHDVTLPFGKLLPRFTLIPGVAGFDEGRIGDGFRCRGRDLDENVKALPLIWFQNAPRSRLLVHCHRQRAGKPEVSLM